MDNKVKINYKLSTSMLTCMIQQEASFPLIFLKRRSEQKKVNYLHDTLSVPSTPDQIYYKQLFFKTFMLKWQLLIINPCARWYKIKDAMLHQKFDGFVGTIF